MRPLMFCSSIRSASTPASPLAPGRSRASVRLRVALDRHPAHLDVAEEHHAGRAPVLERVREHVGVHERAPGLARAELAEFAVGVAQPERRLARVDARAEQLELELSSSARPATVGVRRLHAEAASGARRRTCCRPCRTRPSNDGSFVTRIVSNQFGLICLKFCADVEHREAVDRHRRLRLLRRRCAGVLRPGGRRASPAAPAPAPACRCDA